MADNIKNAVTRTLQYLIGHDSSGKGGRQLATDFLSSTLSTGEGVAAVKRIARDAPRRRAVSLNTKRRPVMSSPPTITLSKGTGVSAANASSGGSGYVVGDMMTVAGGTSVYPAVLQVTSVSGGAVTGAAVVTPGCYSVAPSNPVSIASTTGAGTGATFNLTLGGTTLGSFGPSTVYNSVDPAVARNIVEPITNVATSGFNGGAAYLGEEARFAIKTDAQNLDLTILGFNATFQIWIDGERVQQADFTTDSSAGAYLLRITFAAVGPKNVVLRGVNLAVRHIRVPVGYSIWKPTGVGRPLGYSVGDSYTFGTVSGTLTEGLTARFVDVMASALGLDLIPLGIGGTGWTSSGGNLPVTRVNNDLAKRSVAPDYIFFPMGYNDGASAPNTSLITTNMTDALNATIAAYPLAKVLVIGPWTPLGATANLTTVKTTMAAVVASFPSVTFIDIENVVNSTNKALYTGPDNTHPNDAGHEYLGGRLAELIDPYL